jgi:tetratricopeptide (TPR) repeat protein
MAAGKPPLLPYLTWANGVRGGVLALGGWAGIVVVYMGMRLLGIGPVGTLVAAGVMEERDPIILADFENRTADSLLGQAVTEAFRVDLAQSPVVTLMDPATVTRVLERMQRSPEEPFTEELAREVAVREGVGAVVAGDVTTVGGRYVLAARLFAPGDGALLAAARETANDSTEIIAAVDRLSEELRKKVGESLKTIRGNEPLAAVTTGSLEALLKYSGAIRALNQGEVTRAIGLLQEAVELDTAFAMAYRKLGVTALNRAERVAALTKAYEYRDRLTDRERYQTLGTYYTVVRDDEESAIAAYRAVLETYPYDYVALNNLALIYMQRRDYAQAERLLLRAVAADSFVSAAYINASIAQVAQGKFDEARDLLTGYAEHLPEHPRVRYIMAGFESARGNRDAAEALVRQMLDEHRGDPLWSTNASFGLATLALVRGRLEEAEQHIQAALATGAELDQPGMELAARIQLAVVQLWHRGDKAGALRQVDEALERFPVHELDPLNRPYGSLAMFFALAEEPRRAAAMLDEYERTVEPSLRMDYEEGRHSIQGMLELARGRTEAAVEEFRAADAGPCSICALPLIGMAYDQGGNADSAIAVYERYVTTPWLGRDETDWWGLGFVYERLGQLHAERGEADRAVEYYGELVELWENADPELQPRVEQARREMTRLAGEPRAGE